MLTGHLAKHIQRVSMQTLRKNSSPQSREAWHPIASLNPEELAKPTTNPDGPKKARSSNVCCFWKTTSGYATFNGAKGDLATEWRQVVAMGVNPWNTNPESE